MVDYCIFAGMELISTYICKELDLGIHHNMFGGRLMSLIDDAAAAYAAQLCDSPRVVTVKFDEFVFKKPVKAGNILKIYAKLLRFGTSSVEMYLEVRKHSVYTGYQEIVTHTKGVFVHIDEDGRPIPIAPVARARFEKHLHLSAGETADLPIENRVLAS